jgi:hypothetical protein
MMKALLATVTALLLLSCAWSQPADDLELPRWAPLGGPIFLLVANPAVQDELRLSVKQRTEIAALERDAKEIYRGWSKLDWKARDQKTITEQIMTSNRLGKILKEEQLKRLEQIDQQRRGPVIIFDDRASAPLKLSREQRQKLEILAERTERASNHLSLQLANADPKDGLRRRRIAEEFVKLHADANIRVETELSEEQKRAWQSIRGKAFDLRLLLQSKPALVQ